MFDETPFDSGEPDPVKNELLFKDVHGQTDHCQLIGLQPNAEYFTRVQVFNGAGFGPKGEWRRTETANYCKYNVRFISTINSQNLFVQTVVSSLNF